MSKLAVEYQLIEAIGRGTGRYYTLFVKSALKLKGEMSYERNITLNTEKVKIQILSIFRKAKSH